MKRLLLIILFVVITAFNSSFLDVKKSVEIVVKSSSEVSISGTSNINSFSCCYNIAKLEDPIPISFEENDEKIFFQSTTLELENNCFDCGHSAINKDFKKLLKTDIYPNIRLTLIAIEKTTKLKNIYNASVNIRIADCTNTYTFPVQVVKAEDFRIEGDLMLDLLDFNLKAPKKMMGLIVVNRDIMVNFNLHLKQV